MNRGLLLCAVFVFPLSNAFSQSNAPAADMEKIRQSKDATQQQLNDQKTEAERLKSQQDLQDFLNAQSRSKNARARTKTNTAGVREPSWLLKSTDVAVGPAT